MTVFPARLGWMILRFAMEALYYVCFPVAYPILVLKRYTASINPQYPNINKGIMVHAASLGEVNAVRSLLQDLSMMFPDKQIFITTTSNTGMKAAAKIGGNIRAALSVLDIPHLRRRQLLDINPGLICVVETEIWPNLLYEASQQEIPVIFLNARMGTRTLHRLQPFHKLIRLLGASIKEIYASTEKDAARFAQLFKVPVTVAGNIKTALRLPAYDTDSLRASWGFTNDDCIICAGSTRPGEEKLLLDLLPLLHESIPSLKLILAIRHPQRINEVKSLCRKVDYRQFSLQDSTHNSKEVLILDVLGQLDKAYAICDIAIVGGSFFDFGGHNPLEPVYFGKAVIMGHYHSSCAASVQSLQKASAILLADKDNLAETILNLYRNVELRSKMGRNGKQVLEDSNRSLEVHLEGIAKWVQRIG